MPRADLRLATLRRRADPRALAWGALLALAPTLLAAVALKRAYGPHDEGLMLAWAARIADGQWQYRDFWSNYAPGQPLLLAALWKVLGPSLVTWRVLRVVVVAASAVVAYLLVRRDAGRRWALAAWAGVAAGMAWPAGPGPVPTATLLALAAALAARRSAAAGGALAGLAAFVRPEVGVAAAAGVALVAADRRDTLRALAVAAGVAALAYLPWAIAAGADLPDQLLGFAGVQHLQRLPLVPGHALTADPNKLLERLFPALLVAGVGVYAAVVVTAGPPRRALWPAPLVAVGVAYLLARADEFHLVPLAPALAVGLASAAPYARASGPRWAAAIAVAVVVAHGIDRRLADLRHVPPQAAVPAAVAHGVTTSPADAAALARLLPAVERRAPPGSTVLVAPPRYDRVRVGDPMLNVLLGRRSPTRYDVMQPGVVTTATVQREMAREVRAARTPVVVRWLAPTARALEPNGSARSSGVDLLDAAIARDFREVARFGYYALLQRR